MERFYGVVNCKSCPSPVYLVTARPVTHWTKFEPSSSREGELERLHKKKLSTPVPTLSLPSCITPSVEFVLLMGTVDLKR